MNQYFVVTIEEGNVFQIVVSTNNGGGGGGGVTSVGLQTGTTGTDVNVTNSPITGSGNIQLNIPVASATNTGKLSSADWSTFNGKQNALGFTPEDVANKSTDVVTDQASNTKYPSVKAVYDWIVNLIANYVPYTGATADVNLGTHKAIVDAVEFSLTPTASPGAGQIAYKGNTGALAYLMNSSAVESTIGQTTHAYVNNADSVTILKGQPVYLFGANGNKASVKLANNTSDTTSAKTFGLAAENITSGQNGFVICQGVLDGLNTGAYNPGDTLYVGATAGTLTSTKPYAPNHLVYVGVVEKANNGAGQIYVRVQNGYELDEIHDVDLISTPPANNDVLTYVTGSPNLWKPRSIATILGYTPEDVANKSTSTSLGTSNTLYPSQNAVKSYVDTAVSNRVKILTNNTGTFSVTGSTSEVIALEVLIPAGTITGGTIELDWIITRVTGTAGSISSRIKISSTSGTLGTLLATATALSSTNNWQRPTRTMAYKSATSTLMFAAATQSATDEIASTAAASSINIDWTINQYIQFTLQNQNIGDTSAIQLATIKQLA